MTSNNLTTMLLRVIALTQTDVRAKCIVSFGVGTMVPTHMKSGLYPCTNILLKTNVNSS